MSARIVVLAAVAAVLAATAVLLLTDSYSGSSCSSSASGLRECTDTSSTLVEENGRGVLFTLAVPVFLVVCVAALVWLRGPKWLEVAIAVLVLGACMIALASIGFLYLPAAVLALVAVALDYRVKTTPTKSLG